MGSHLGNNGNGHRTAKARVLIADPQRLFAEGLRLALADRGLDVAEVSCNEEEALAMAEAWSPDLALVGLDLPVAGGIDVGRRLLNGRSRPTILVLGDRSASTAWRDAQRSGLGYVSKDTSMARFIVVLNEALKGNVSVSTAASGGGARGEVREAGALTRHLTSRERDVLTLLVEGASGRRIAEALRISHHTVRGHVHSILTKLQVHSRLEAAAFAVRSGVVKPPWRNSGRE